MLFVRDDNLPFDWIKVPGFVDQYKDDIFVTAITF